MAFVARCFWHAKDLDHASDYEDAFDASPESGRAAIADGVSSAIFSRQWARILTAAAVAAPPNWDEPESVSTWIGEQRRAWSKAIDVNTLPWMQRMKLQESGGGYAAILWVELTPHEATEGERPFRAIASGDCCLFHVRDGQLLGRFPLSCEADFERDPVTWGSSTRNRDRSVPFQSLYGTCRDGDWLVLSSDALAKWLYRLSDGGLDIPWSSLWEQSAVEWTRRVATLRDLPAAERIRVDDTTLLILAIGPPSSSVASPGVRVTAATCDSALLAAAEEVVMAELVEPQAVEPQAVEPQAVEPQAVEPQVVEPQAVEPQAVEPQAVEPTSDEPHSLEEAPLASPADSPLEDRAEIQTESSCEPQTPEPQTPEPQTPEPQTPPRETSDNSLTLESLALDLEPLALPSLSPLDSEPKPSGHSSSPTSEEG